MNTNQWYKLKLQKAN